MPNSVNSDYRFGLHPLTRLLHSRVRGCYSLKRSEYTMYSEADFMLGCCSLKRSEYTLYSEADFVLGLNLIIGIRVMLFLQDPNF
jgi:hypothetical protein